MNGINERMNGWMDAWVGGWMDGWTKNKNTATQHQLSLVLFRILQNNKPLITVSYSINQSINPLS
jgi:hypothetical protein